MPIARGMLRSLNLLRARLAIAIERKQSEEALLESQKRYKNFITHSSEGIYRVEIVPPMSIELSQTEIIKWINKHAVVAEVNEALAMIIDLVVKI
jgi:hypothetical protein